MLNCTVKPVCLLNRSCYVMLFLSLCGHSCPPLFSGDIEGLVLVLSHGVFSSVFSSFFSFFLNIPIYLFSPSVIYIYV